MQFELKVCRNTQISKTNKNKTTKKKQKNTPKILCFTETKKVCLEVATELIGVHSNNGNTDKTCYETLERTQKALGKANRRNRLHPCFKFQILQFEEFKQVNQIG